MVSQNAHAAMLPGTLQAPTPVDSTASTQRSHHTAASQLLLPNTPSMLPSAAALRACCGPPRCSACRPCPAQASAPASAPPPAWPAARRAGSPPRSGAPPCGQAQAAGQRRMGQSKYPQQLQRQRTLPGMPHKAARAAAHALVAHPLVRSWNSASCKFIRFTSAAVAPGSCPAGRSRVRGRRQTLITAAILWAAQ